MTSRLYQRTIKIERLRKSSGEGGLGYGGAGQERPELIREEVPASVQARNAGSKNPTGLPSDGKMAQWYVLTPRDVLRDGEVRNGDVITDDLGRRFSVTSDYSAHLGARFTCDRLEP